MPEQLTAVSLFAGVGGFDLALERNGIKVVASVEIDKHARSILAQKFPNSTIMNDVRNVTKEALQNAGFIPEHGIITGGFPCQDLSNAGKRAGLAGARSGLFYEIVRIADETKAKWLVLENVPGLLTSQRGADMGAVIGTLVELGYGVAWRVLDAQHFGVPQRRRRVFIVAERAGDATGPAQVLFERQSLRRDSSTSGETRQETALLAGQGLTSTNRMTAFGQYAEDDDSASTLKASDYKSAKDLVTEGELPALLTMREGVTGQGGRGPLIKYDQSLTLATGNGQVLFNLEDMKLAVRRLTPLECERLQGFPDGWTEGQADSHRYKQMGNAVAVPVVEWVIQGIIKAEQQ